MHLGYSDVSEVEAYVDQFLHDVFARVRLAYPLTKKEIHYSLHNHKLTKFIRDILPLKNRYSVK